MMYLEFHHKMIFDCMKEAKHIYTGLKILKIRTNINPLYVSFAIDLLLELKRFTVCQRITLVLIPKDYLCKVTKDTMRQCSEVRNQYIINDGNLKDLLLSSRSRKN
jgi:hypothetical protein